MLTARPPQPAPSDTALVTAYGYQADEVQRVTPSGGSAGSTFTLTFTDHTGSQTTAGIDRDASAAAVQAALQALSKIGPGGALVSGPAGGPWLVRFAAGLAGANVRELTGARLAGSPPPAVAVATEAQGGDAGRVQAVTDARRHGPDLRRRGRAGLAHGRGLQ